jgi:hypothetical protein
MKDWYGSRSSVEKWVSEALASVEIELTFEDRDQRVAGDVSKPLS